MIIAVIKHVQMNISTFKMTDWPMARPTAAAVRLAEVVEERPDAEGAGDEREQARRVLPATLQCGAAVSKW